MLKEFLKLSWDDVQDSNYLFKSHNAKHVVQIEGPELGGPLGSMLLTYYNLNTGLPMIAMWRTEGEDLMGIEDVEGFRFMRETHNGRDGEKWTETVYIEESIGTALD